jgi:hypothetical protein
VAEIRKPKERELRTSARVSVRFPVTFYGRQVEGTAQATNVSATGAFLQDADPLLITGGKIRLRFSLAADALPIDVWAEVVRETETGFAVRFTKMEPRIRAVLKTAISKAIRATELGVDDPDDDDDEDKTLLSL